LDFRTETYSVVVLYAYNTIKLLKQAFLQTFSVDRLKNFCAKLDGRQIFWGKIGRATK